MKLLFYRFVVIFFGAIISLINAPSLYAGDDTIPSVSSIQNVKTTSAGSIPGVKTPDASSIPSVKAPDASSIPSVKTPDASSLPGIK